MTKGTLDSLLLTIDDLRAKLAEAEAQNAADSALILQLTEGMEQYCRLRDADPIAAKLAAAESRVAALTEALAECEEWFDGRADVDDGPDGQPVPNSAMRMQQLCAAALFPSQDAKGGA